MGREWGMLWARTGSPILPAFQLEFWSVQPGLADFIIKHVFVKVKKIQHFISQLFVGLIYIFQIFIHMVEGLPFVLLP